MYIDTHTHIPSPPPRRSMHCGRTGDHDPHQGLSVSTASFSTEGFQRIVNTKIAYIYIYIYIYVCIHIRIHIYICIERERTDNSGSSNN